MDVFWGASRLRLLVPVVVVAVIASLALSNRTAPPPDVVAVLGLLIIGMLTFGLVRLEVADDGVRAGLGPWGFPRRSFGWDRLAEARPVTVGWVLGGRARGVGFYCVRPGPAMQFTLRGGRHLAVSIGRPDVPPCHPAPLAVTVTMSPGPINRPR